MDLPQLMILVGFIGTCHALFYIILNICLKPFGVHAHEYSTSADSSVVTMMMKHIETKYICSTSTHAEKPVGLIFGKWFVAYITTFTIPQRDSSSMGYVVTFWSSNKGHKKSLTDDSINPEKENKTAVTTLETWRHVGCYKAGSVEKFDIPFHNEPCAEQAIVVTRIMDMIAASITNGYGNRISVVIAGPSGTGKTQIAKQLAYTMNATICDDFNPTIPGQNFASLIKTIKPVRKKPLVVLLDECDKMMGRIHTGVPEHEFFVTQATDKASWNMFMDRMSDFDNVIVILTMNSPFNEIDKLDLSYTRPGRVDLKVNFGGTYVYNPEDDECLHVKPFANMATTINAKRFTLKPVVIATK